MQHIEFFDTEHFENNYHRVPPAAALSAFIEFFWETDFDKLWDENSTSFSDVLFPNIGYTYIINLGTPFMLEIKGGKTYEMRTDGFLPRHSTIECEHVPGNHLFGIKFRVSPLVYETRINFSEYKAHIFPLTYLLDKQVVHKVKNALTFEERKDILSNYFLQKLLHYEEKIGFVSKVLDVIETVFQTNNFSKSVEEIAAELNVSTRTLQRYFEMTTGFGCKQALQVMRIRKAVSVIANAPETFDYRAFGYYDYSHFYKHLIQFIGIKTKDKKAPHLRLLEKLRY